MDLLDPQVIALKTIIEAQQDVIGSWELVFASVEDTILKLVRLNLELKIKLLRETNPDIEVPENVYQEMDTLKMNYRQGNISAITYFEALGILLNAMAD